MNYGDKFTSIIAFYQLENFLMRLAPITQPSRTKK